jgi:hypothetical protein
MLESYIQSALGARDFLIRIAGKYPGITKVKTLDQSNFADFVFSIMILAISACSAY